MSEFVIEEWNKEGYLISTDENKLDLAAIHRYLTTSTWAAGIDEETVNASIQNSLNFGLYHQSEQIGFARLITDYATFAYLCDVYVLDAYQGNGLARWLMACIHAHPVFERLRRIRCSPARRRGCMKSLAINRSTSRTTRGRLPGLISTKTKRDKSYSAS